MPSHVLTQYELEFHSRIMMEHAIFLYLGLEDADYKEQARQEWVAWDQFINQGYPLSELSGRLQSLRSLKQRLLQALVGGQWLGWSSASVVRHFLEELEYFALLASGQEPNPSVTALQALRLTVDHLQFAQSLTDESADQLRQREMDLLRLVPETVQELAHRSYNPTEVLQEYQQAVTALAQEEGQPANDVQWMIGLTLRSGQEIDDLFASIQQDRPLTVIHPLLLDHWRREGHYHSSALSMTLQELQS